MKSKAKKYNQNLRNLEKKIVRQNIDKTSEKEFEELEHKVSEDPRESREGLGIEKDENAGEEAYPEIKKFLEHEDKPDHDEDDEEEEY